jgi:hypothetical protein
MYRAEHVAAHEGIKKELPSAAQLCTEGTHLQVALLEALHRLAPVLRSVKVGACAAPHRQASSQAGNIAS